MPLPCATPLHRASWPSLCTLAACAALLVPLERAAQLGGAAAPAGWSLAALRRCRRCARALAQRRGGGHAGALCGAGQRGHVQGRHHGIVSCRSRRVKGLQLSAGLHHQHMQPIVVLWCIAAPFRAPACCAVDVPSPPALAAFSWCPCSAAAVASSSAAGISSSGSSSLPALASSATRAG